MQSTRSKLIQLLANEETNDGYISGQDLSEQLNISRSAIWKHMKELKKDGYDIEGVARKGYRIKSFPNKISENTIKWGLKTDWLGQSVYHYDSIDSTQHVAHRLAKDGAAHGTVVLADEQTSGKGRMDRAWHSQTDRGLWMSFILRPNILPFQAPQLTLLTATVLAHVIDKLTELKPQIKWPNDILLDSKKIAGILTEMQAEQDQVTYIVIGIGLNVNQDEEDLPDLTRNNATSIFIESKKELDMLPLIRAIFEHFESVYDSFIKDGFKNIKKEWEKFGFKLGYKLSITTGDSTWTGTFIGIAEDGALLARDEDGLVKKLYSAEIAWFKEES